MIKIQIHNTTQHYVLALNSTMQTSEIKLMHNSFLIFMSQLSSLFFTRVPVFKQTRVSLDGNET